MQLSNDSQKLTQEHIQAAAEPVPVNQQIKSVTPMTFSQKLYQAHSLEIAEEYEQALEANSLERIKMLLDKVLGDE